MQLRFHAYAVVNTDRYADNPEPPTQEEINLAVKVFLSKGGSVTKMDEQPPRKFLDPDDLDDSKVIRSVVAATEPPMQSP